MVHIKYIGWFLIFVDYNNSDYVRGAFIIHWLTFEFEYMYNTYDGYSDYFNVNNYWSSIDNGISDIEKTEDGLYNIHYNKNDGQQWSFVITRVRGDFSRLSTVAFGLEFAEGVKFIVKLEGVGFGKEYQGEGTGAYQNYQMDVSDLTTEQKFSIDKVLIFVEWNTSEPVSESYSIHWMEFNFSD